MACLLLFFYLYCFCRLVLSVCHIPSGGGGARHLFFLFFSFICSFPSSIVVLSFRYIWIAGVLHGVPIVSKYDAMASHCLPSLLQHNLVSLRCSSCDHTNLSLF